MLNIISENFAAKAMMLLFSLIIIFHLLVITQVIPMSIVWGGRLTEGPMFYRFEIVSILLNLLMLFIVWVRTGALGDRINQKAITAVLWLMVALFLLNTVGNILAFTNLEKYVFTPLTIIMALLSLRLALSRNKQIE